jgi:hypothetical protein
MPNRARKLLNFYEYHTHATTHVQTSKMDSGLSEYERIRLENIKRNESFLTGIGLPSNQLPKRKPASSAGKRKVVERVHIEGERKSSRIRNAPTDHKQLNYAESDDDNALFGEEENERRASKSTKSKRVSTREVIKYETKPVNTSSSKSSREVDANYSIFIGFDADMDHMRYDEDAGDLSGGAAPSRAPGGDFKEVNGKWVMIEGSGGSGKKSASSSASKKGSSKGTSTSTEKAAAPSSSSSSSSSTTNNYRNNNLGRMLEEVGFGKAAIMAASHHGTAPKFSKYSGVVEWRNCVYVVILLTYLPACPSPLA